MDGFRDRLNRGTSDRGAYDRYDRSRRSSFSSGSSGAGVDEIMRIVDDSNAKQLDYISDLFEDAKEDRFESEKQILAAIEDIKAVTENSAAKVENTPAPVDPLSEQILRTATSNNDLLAQFAEEQLPMLVRGNSSILNQIRTDLAEKDEILREILSGSSQGTNTPASSNDEILSAAENNNALINALRSDVAGIQAEIRRVNDRAENDTAPLDTEDAFTKAQAEEMYKNMEENVHAECVKVYRNVQKVVEDQNAAIVNEVKGSVGGIKGLTILNLVLLILNLAAVLLRIFGII